jgi:hypothetical protein
MLVLSEKLLHRIRLINTDASPDDGEDGGNSWKLLTNEGSGFPQGEPQRPFITYAFWTKHPFFYNLGER